MSDSFPPFSIREVEYAFYRSDADDRPVGDALWMGKCLEDLTPSEQYEELRLDRHGDPFRRIYHSDEEHEIAFRNLWSASGGSAARMPKLGRNQAVIVVVRWYDEESEAWCKRAYFRVTSGGRRLELENESYYQALALKAARYTEVSGYQNPPDLTVPQLGLVRYVSDSETVDLYQYEFGSGIFDPIDVGLLAGRAEIIEAAGVWRLEIGGEIALQANATELLMEELTAIGGTFALGTATPRVEFWIGPRRIAAVTQDGELCAPGVEEANAAPAVAEAFEIKVDGGWVASVAPGRVVALEVAETEL